MSNEAPLPTLSRNSDTCSPNIEELLHKAELENSEHVKLIQAENQRYAALQRQLEAKKRQIEDLEKSTKQLDEQAKTLHRHFKQNREICESLKKTNDILNEHEEAIQRRNEDLRSKAQREHGYHKKMLEKYRTIWERYFEVYESNEAAKCLRDIKEKTSKFEEQVRTIEEKIGGMKEGIRRNEMGNNQEKESQFTITVNGILKLAKLYLDGRKKANEVEKVKESIKRAERAGQAAQANQNKKADHRPSPTPVDLQPATGQEPETAAMDDNAVGTVLDAMPQPPAWSTPNQLEASSPHSPRTGAGNQKDSVVQIGSAERLAKTPLSSVLGSPGTPDGHDPSHMKQGEACGTQANATSEPVVCSLEDGGQFAAPDPPSFNSFLAQLTTTPARSSQSENAALTQSSPGDQVQPPTSAENSQVHSSPGPSARTVDPAKSPFSFELHSYRLEQLAKSPGEGFLFHGRPMFNGTGDQSGDVSMPGFFQSFLDSNNHQGQATNFTGSELPGPSPSAQENSRVTGESSSTGFLSGTSVQSSSNATMNLFGSPVGVGQEPTSTAYSGEPRPQFQMFAESSSQPAPSSTQQSQLSFSLSFGAPAMAEKTHENRPLFGFF